MGTKEKYLFVVPSASINGALILLMNFFDHLQEKHGEIVIETIVQWGKGENQDTFFRDKLQNYGKVTFLQELSDREKSDLKSRILKEKIEAIFYNSIISAETQQFLAEKNCKRIFYVHEMERLMNVFNLKQFVEFYNQKNNLFIAGSESVRKDLISVLQLRADRITVLHSFINPELIKSKRRKSSELKNDLPEKEFTIGFSGTFELRKSADLLLPLVVEIKKRIKNPKIFWIGASSFIGEPNTYDLVMHDVKIGGFENDIHFVPKSLDYIKYHERFDVYVLLSREDPFPLINLEMGVLGVPIICFEKAGGSPDYAKMGGGVTVPFMDLGAVADAIKEFHDNPQLLADYRNKTPGIVERNFSVDIQAPKLLTIVRNFLK